MTGRGVLLIGLVYMMILSCGGGEPHTSENHCAEGVCDEANLTVNATT